MDVGTFTDVTQAAVAVAIGFFTWSLWRMEGRRDNHAVRPLLAVSAVGEQDPSVKNTVFFHGEILQIRNYGEGPAVGCRIEWTPTDVPPAAGYKSMYELGAPVGPFNLAAGESIPLPLSVQRERALREGAHKETIVAPNPQFGPQTIGALIQLGTLTVHYQRIDGKTDSQVFTISGRYLAADGNLQFLTTSPELVSKTRRPSHRSSLPLPRLPGRRPNL